MYVLKPSVVTTDPDAPHFSASLHYPTRRRRLLVLIYDALLLFGVVFLADYAFDTLTQSRHGLSHRHSRQFFLFLVIGAYFVSSWYLGGQTLAMKTWRIRLLDAVTFRPPSLRKACARYLLSYVMTLSGINWLWSWFDPERQSLHDRLLRLRVLQLERNSSPVDAKFKPQRTA